MRAGAAFDFPGTDSRSPAALRRDNAASRPARVGVSWPELAAQSVRYRAPKRSGPLPTTVCVVFVLIHILITWLAVLIVVAPRATLAQRRASRK